MSLSKKSIILHLGAQKTGSTSFQHLLGVHEPLLEKAGIGYPHRFILKGDVDPLFRLLHRARYAADRASPIAEARERLDYLFRVPNRHSLLISNESLLGEPFAYPHVGFFPELEKTIEILSAVFEGYQIEAHFVTRDYASVIASYYVQYVRRGGSCSLSEFAKMFDHMTDGWPAIIAALQHIFGTDAVFTYDYADFCLNPAPFYQRIFKDINLAMALAMSAPQMRKNKSVGGLPLRLTRACNHILKNHMGYPPKKAGNLTRTYILPPASWILPAQKPKLPQGLRAALDAKYAADCPHLEHAHPSTRSG